MGQDRQCAGPVERQFGKLRPAKRGPLSDITAPGTRPGAIEHVNLYSGPTPRFSKAPAWDERGRKNAGGIAMVRPRIDQGEPLDVCQRLVDRNQYFLWKTARRKGDGVDRDVALIIVTENVAEKSGAEDQPLRGRLQFVQKTSRRAEIVARMLWIEIEVIQRGAETDGEQHDERALAPRPFDGCRTSRENQNHHEENGR